MKTIQEIRDRCEKLRTRGDFNDNYKIADDIDALLKCVKILTRNLEFYSKTGSSERHSATEWADHNQLLVFGKFGELCEHIKPYQYAEDALDEVGAILGSSHIANRDSQYEPKHQPYTSAFDLEQLTIKDVDIKLDPKSTFKNEDGYLTGTIEDPENEGKIK